MMIMIMMKPTSKIVGMSSIVALSIVVLSIVTLSAAPLVTGAWADANHASPPLTGSSERAPTCHGHGSAILPHSHPRLPAPESYRCCLTGHDAAVVRTSYLAQP